MIKGAELFRWSMVGLIAVSMLVATVALRNSQFYLLFNNPTVWQVINGETPPNFAFGDVFLPQLNGQIKRAQELAAYKWDWLYCISIHSTPEIAIKGIYGLLEQINPGDLLYRDNGNSLRGSVIVNAHPPYTVSYHFSISPKDFYTLDSISGIDSLLLQYAHLPNVSAVQP
jgi:hypothetical protein